ncbi:hypothetical protein QYF36_016652 [Acer negundo]|nr:hypothetical protein QYF36_016652 [Acer negundo]
MQPCASWGHRSHTGFTGPFVIGRSGVSSSSKNLDSCSTRLSLVRIRCFPTVSGPPLEAATYSSTDDAVSLSIIVEKKL